MVARAWPDAETSGGPIWSSAYLLSQGGLYEAG
jgi:hypothetical protein